MNTRVPDSPWRGGQTVSGRYYWRDKDGRRLFVERGVKRWRLKCDQLPAHFEGGGAFPEFKTAVAVRRVADSYDWTTGRAVNPDKVDTAAELQRVIERAKREIVDDVKHGIVPPTVPDYSALHDYTDANKYGGAFEEGAHPVEDTDFWNAMQEACDEWIKAGGLRKAAE